MRRSTFLKLGLLAFGLVLVTFVVRGTTRLVIGDQSSMLLSLPFAGLALVLVIGLFVIAVLEWTGLKPLDDDLG